MITDPTNIMKLASDHCNRVTSVEDRARFYHSSSYVALEGFFSKTCGNWEAHAYTTGELHHHPPLFADDGNKGLYIQATQSLSSGALGSLAVNGRNNSLQLPRRRQIYLLRSHAAVSRSYEFAQGLTQVQALFVGYFLSSTLYTRSIY